MLRGHIDHARITSGVRRAGRRVFLAVCLASMIVTGTARPSNGLSFPSPEDVIGRVITAAGQVNLASAVMVIKVRIGAPLIGPLACVFQGVLHVTATQTTLAVSHSTPSPLCWTIERYVLGSLFDDRDHAKTLLSSFQFDVLGEKLTDGRPYFLVYGRALPPQTDPLWMIGWVDYDRGLVVDGTIQYAWGRVNLTQNYADVAGVWVLDHQVLDVPRFGASLEISYSDFQFLPRP